MTRRFDAIVVGAGPAGCAASVTLARKGARVLCLERGEYPGAKNASGGVLYGDLLQEIFPEATGDLPVERRITRHGIVLAARDNLLNFHHRPVGEGTTKCGYSVLRHRLDSWLSQEAERAGVKLLTETVVDDVIVRKGRAVGVQARRRDGVVSADLVVLADGVNSLLSKRLGLRGELRPRQMVLAAKEVIRLPEHVIEARFDLKEDEGAAYLMIGDVTDGIEGGAFFYTNRSSLSLGLACSMNGLIREKAKIHELLERFKGMAWVSQMIEGGILKEYSAHLIPSFGYAERPKLAAPGVLVVGDAAGLTLNNGLTVRGMDFALASGMAAGETGIEALSKGDLSTRALGTYEGRLKASFVLRDLRTFRKAKDAMRNRALYAVYPALLGEVFAGVFSATGEPKRRMLPLLRDGLRRRGMLSAAIVDCFKLGRSL